MSPHYEAFMTRITWVRVEWRTEIRTVRLTAIRHDDLTEEIRLDGRVIGFIHRAGHIFVALLGAQSDRAVECEQSPLWDRTAARLIIESGGFPEMQTPPSHPARREWAVRYRIRTASPTLARSRPRSREKSQ